MEFHVDRILAAGEVHLIYGPSGAGKSTLALQIMESWTQGSDLFGYQTHPVPMCYLACERSSASLRRQMKAMGIDSSKHPNLSLLMLRHDERNVRSALRLARKINSAIRVLFLDGLQSLCPGKINDHRDSTRFLIETAQLCQEENITIVGCAASSKSREGEGYASPRDRLLGAGAWASTTDLKAYIDYGRPSDVTHPYRRMSLMPSTEIPKLIHYEFENHRLVMRSQAELLINMDTWLASQSSGEVFTSAQLQGIAEQFHMSRTAFYLWLRDQVELGALRRLAHSKYSVGSEDVVLPG